MRKVRISILALACGLLTCTASTSCSSSVEDSNIPESPTNPEAPGNTDGSNGSGNLNGPDGSNGSGESNGSDGPDTGGSSNTGNPSGIKYSSLITKTQAYPDNYTNEAEHRGRVERIDYNTRNYAEGTNRSRSNTAYVYLPYGYDANTSLRYNVIYLVHGHYGTASTTFEAENGLQRKVLDHMTFHEKDGARHEFRPTVEYVYNALPFFFPANRGETTVKKLTTFFGNKLK